MRQQKYRVMGACVSATVLLGGLTLGTLPLRAAGKRAIFVIALENHNWEQPVHKFDGGQQQIYLNPAAPYLTGLVNGTVNGVSDQVSYAKAYYHVLATPTGPGVAFSIHPSEPNYLWAEAGTNFGILNDNDPYSGSPTFPNNHDTTVHLSGYLAAAGYSWKSYQEDADLAPTGAGTVNRPATSTGGLRNTPVAPGLWTVPLASFAGTFVSPDVNAYNRTNQYNYAAKHTPQAFFTDTNGGNITTNLNTQSLNYAPLQQLASDLSFGTIADYNWITPNQFNDMHTAVNGTYTGLDGKPYTGDPARIKQGDDFIAQIIPTIMASNAYKDGGVIIIWTDETEPAGTGDTPSQNDFQHTLSEIIISKDARANVSDGQGQMVPYSNSLYYTHSSDVRTLQEIFGIGTAIRDAANANDLADLFRPGVISHADVDKNLTISAGESVTFSSGTVGGDIKVNGGTLFLSNGSRVKGNVQVTSGNVSIANSTVDGNLQFQGGGNFAIGAGAVVGGNLSIQNLPVNPNAQTVCGATVGGNLQVQNNAAPLAFGAVAVPGASLACGNTIGGNMQVQENTGAVQVINSTVKKNLICQSNSAITGSGNAAKSKQDQCSIF
jgi:hypothetical protein